MLAGAVAPNKSQETAIILLNDQFHSSGLWAELSVLSRDGLGRRKAGTKTPRLCASRARAFRVRPVADGEDDGRSWSSWGFMLYALVW